MIISRQALVDDLAWCWWTQPRATRVGDTLFLGGIASDGAVFAATWHLRTGATERAVLARIESDDHNNPAVVAVPGKPLLAFWSRHDADDALRFRIGTRPCDLGDWSDERTLEFGGITTYAQAHVRGDEIHLFTRVGDTRWGYAWSPDWGRSWSTPRDFIALETDQETYMPTALLPDGRTLRVAIAGHPKDYEQHPWHRIGACVVDLATLRDATLPLRDGDLEPVFEAPAGRTLNVLDVGDGPEFEIAFSSKLADDNATEDARYQVARLRDGRWEVEDVAPAGDVFGYIHAGFYVGGISFPHATAGGRAFVSREQDGVWHLEQWRRDDDGTWSPTPLVEPSATRIVRPFPVRNPAPGLEVVALRLERYDHEYVDTLSHLVAAAAP